MGAPRRAELGSHGNGGRGALGVRVEGCNALNRKGRRGRASWDAAPWGRHGQGRQRRVAQGHWRGRVAMSGAAREGRVHANQGRGAGFGWRRDAWAARWPRRRMDAVVGVVQGGER